jgi:hypothetical protein
MDPVFIHSSDFSLTHLQSVVHPKRWPLPMSEDAPDYIEDQKQRKSQNHPKEYETRKNHQNSLRDLHTRAPPEAIDTPLSIVLDTPPFGSMS